MQRSGSSFIANHVLVLTSRMELLLAGGLPALVQRLEESCPMIIRQFAAGAILGLATERKERQAAILEVLPPMCAHKEQLDTPCCSS